MKNILAQRLRDALREFAEDRGYTLDEGPRAQLIIPVMGSDANNLRVATILLTAPRLPHKTSQ